MIEVYHLIECMMDSFKVEGIEPPFALGLKHKTYVRMCGELGATKIIDDQLKIPPFVRLTIRGDDLFVMRHTHES